MDDGTEKIKICTNERGFMRKSGADPFVLSIVIVSYNTKDVVKQCLDSIIMSEITLPYEIIVVDNGSRDGTNELIESRYDDVTLLKNEKNLLFAKANNQGVRAARGAYILLMNSDTMLQKGLAERLIKFLIEHPKAAAAGPRVLNLNGTLQSKGAPPISIISTVIRLLGVGKNKLTKTIVETLFPRVCWDENRTSKVGWISGCCMMIKKEAIAEVGGLCEELLFYGEEVEWCYRAIRENWEIWLVPETFVRHVGGASTSTEMRQVLQHKDLVLGNYKLLLRNTVGLKRGIAISFVTVVLSFIKYLVALTIKKEKTFCNDLLGQAKWEVIVFKYLLTNGSKESRA